MTQFTDLGLAEPLLRALNDEGYSTPTPIQSQLIPHALAGKDIIGIAQTGTGKTAAFTLPLLDHIHADRSPLRPRSPKALILAPTRELVLQIAASVRTYGRHVHPAQTEIVGGVKPGPQVRAMAPGVDVVVATPGRLLDHLNAGAIRLDQTGIVILDEADHMFDMGFLPQIRRVMNALPKVRQTLLLSATMPDPIRKLADDFLNDPVSVQVATQARPVERIDQRLIHTPGDKKKDLLIETLSDPSVERAVVFTRTKRGADKVTKTLNAAGISAEAIHGNKSQGQRNRALDSFKRGHVLALVATDVASRGIDIDGVSHVVNFELPNIAESYVHRIGRTARAGRDGIAISFCEGEERAWLRDIEKLIGMQIPASGEMQTEVAPPVPGRGRQQQPRKRGPRQDQPRRGGSDSRSNARSDSRSDTRTNEAKKRRPRPTGARSAAPGANTAASAPSAKPRPAKGKSQPVRFEDGSKPAAQKPRGKRPHTGKPGGPKSGAANSRRNGPNAGGRSRAKAR